MRKAFLILLFLLQFVSCAKYYYSDTNPSYMPIVNIKVIADVERNIKTDIGKDFEENLLYDWDTLKYGKIYSTYFDTVICKVFDSSMKIVDNVEITIAATLLPIKIVVNERSNLLMMRNNTLAVLLPSSALI